MATHTLSRRHALVRAGAALGAAAAGWQFSAVNAAIPVTPPGTHRFTFCLNTSTIRGQKLGIVKEVEIAAKAGYSAIEPWVEAISQYVKSGGSTKDLARRIREAGLTVESSIAFSEWVVDDDARRARGLENTKRDMDLVAQIGGKRIASPPSGATQPAGLDLAKAAERYRALLELGDQMGVQPELELWGFSQNLSRLSEAAYVAIEAGHPKACVLADVFHLYKGGSRIEGLRLLSGAALPVFHLNDYPAEPPRAQINDSFRIFPGDGVAPITAILRQLHADGAPHVVSLELFSKKYWEQDAFEVARTGLEKLKASVARALA